MAVDAFAQQVGQDLLGVLVGQGVIDFYDADGIGMAVEQQSLGAGIGIEPRASVDQHVFGGVGQLPFVAGEGDPYQGDEAHGLRRVRGGVMPTGRGHAPHRRQQRQRDGQHHTVASPARAEDYLRDQLYRK